MTHAQPRTHFRNAAVGLLVVMLGLATACGANVTVSEADSDASSMTAAEACTNLGQAKENIDVIWELQEYSDADVQLAQETEELLLSVAKQLPSDAPADAQLLLDTAGQFMGVLGDVGQLENASEEFLTRAEPLEEIMDNTNWDSTEDWVETNCDIQVYGIEIHVRSDDRTASVPNDG